MADLLALALGGSRPGGGRTTEPPVGVSSSDAGYAPVKGNMTSGNGLGITYTAFNKPATITRGTASIAFDHDPEHQRYAQTSLSGVTFYIAGGGPHRTLT